MATGRARHRRRAGARHPRRRICKRATRSPNISAPGALADFEDDDVADRHAAWRRRSASRSATTITLISPQGTPTAFGTVPRIKTYASPAIFDVGMYEYDNAFIFMPLEAAQLFFKLDDAVTSSR